MPPRMAGKLMNDFEKSELQNDTVDGWDDITVLSLT